MDLEPEGGRLPGPEALTNGVSRVVEGRDFVSCPARCSPWPHALGGQCPHCQVSFSFLTRLSRGAAPQSLVLPPTHTHSSSFLWGLTKAQHHLGHFKDQSRCESVNSVHHSIHRMVLGLCIPMTSLLTQVNSKDTTLNEKNPVPPKGTNTV